jgi:hypothetical protein
MSYRGKDKYAGAKGKYPFTSCEGVESIPMWEKTIKVFPIFGQYITRIIYDPTVKKTKVDFRIFRTTDDGKLAPTAQGAFRYEIQTTRRLYQVLRRVRKYLIQKDLWSPKCEE